ncbi:LOW QUALITY PROTEIN: ATP-binding cassette (ABC) Superfamily [Phytophthora palmivora]|uniref:ATP-binding cassette (ABC) Superfamily n=1 Tax=Phytophthora palmivora TaxID=4796 RepID=A0A2P4XLS5_9STRA|nr:LOW QUALITY PROTEIN: ATP-binding cassette (ABC) Superfamily [Phytophthora palmivora]
MSSKKNYLLLDWLDNQSVVSALILSTGVFPHEGHGSPLFLEQLMGPRPLAGGHASMGAYDHHLIKGMPLFTESIEAARCVLLAPHHIPLQEFIRLRKMPGIKGSLHPVWGFPWFEALFWGWVPHKGCPVKERQVEAQLEFILIQRDLRVQFAHLVVKRQLVTEMEVLRSSTQPPSQRKRGYDVLRQPYPVQLLKSSAQLTRLLPLIPERNSHQEGYLKPAFRLPSVLGGIPTTSLAADSPRSAAALGQPDPHGSGVPRSDQGGQEEHSHAIEYEAPTQPYPSGLPHSGPGPAESFLQDEVHQPSDRIYAIEIAFDIGLGGLAAAPFGKPTALDVLRQDVDALGRETRELHGWVNHRVPASALKELRQSLDALVYEAHDQMPSYEPQ